ncbi:MAG: dUTP diphosphatase [Vulcanimicrobiaceae bacterium]
MRSERVRIEVRRLPEAVGLPLPQYLSEGAAGADICAAVEDELTLAPGARALVPSGLALAIPPGYEVQIRPRSGLALRGGVTLLNAPGTIDADYRGPVGVLLVNLGSEPYVVRRGDRIAQLVVAPVARAAFEEVVTHDTTARAEDGFGSTGR